MEQVKFSVLLEHILLQVQHHACSVCLVRLVKEVQISALYVVLVNTLVVVNQV